MQQQSGDAQFGQQTGKDFKRTFEEKKDRQTGKKYMASSAQKNL